MDAPNIITIAFGLFSLSVPAFALNSMRDLRKD